MTHPATCAAAFTMDSSGVDVLLTLVDRGMKNRLNIGAVLFMVWQLMLP